MRGSGLQATAAAVGFRFCGQAPAAAQASGLAEATFSQFRLFSSDSGSGNQDGSRKEADPASRPPRQPRRTYQRNETWTRLKAPPAPGSLPPKPTPQLQQQGSPRSGDRRPPAKRNESRPPPREGFKRPPRPGQGFAASGAERDGRGPHASRPRQDNKQRQAGRRPQQGGNRPHRHPDQGQQLPASFAAYPTFGEVHGQKDFLAEVYNDRDQTWNFKIGAPGPWEYKEIPTVNGLAADIHDTLESVKEIVMSDYKTSLQAIEAGQQGQLEAGGSSSSDSDSDGESSGSDSDSDNEAEAAIEVAGTDGAHGNLVKPGQDIELVQPKDLEMEALWKNLKDAAMYNVLSHETYELQNKVKKGHSLLGAKQEEAMLQEIAEKEGPEDQALKAALTKYQAVLESTGSTWTFADKRVMMKGLARELRSHS